MLRNMNQVSAGKRICGTPKTGVLGSLIPALGDAGAAYAYKSLSLPADNTSEIRGRIVTFPSTGTLFADEDTSFTFSGAPDGQYSFQFQLSVFSVDIGPVVTVPLSVGPVSVQVAATTDSVIFTGGANPLVISTVAAVTDDATFSGSAFVAGSSNLVNFAVPTDSVIFTGNAASGVAATFNATTDDTSYTGVTTISGAPIAANIVAVMDSTVFTGSSIVPALVIITATTDDCIFSGRTKNIQIKNGVYRDVTMFLKSSGYYSQVTP